MKADVSIQSFDLPFDYPFDCRPRNTRIERRQIKAFLTMAGVSSSQEIGKFETLFSRKAEQILHRRALITDNQERPKKS